MTVMRFSLTIKLFLLHIFKYFYSLALLWQMEFPFLITEIRTTIGFEHYNHVFEIQRGSLDEKSPHLRCHCQESGPGVQQTIDSRAAEHKIAPCSENCCIHFEILLCEGQSVFKSNTGIYCFLCVEYSTLIF